MKGQLSFSDVCSTSLPCFKATQAVAMLLLVWSPILSAQSHLPSDLSRCMAIEAVAERVVCYDQLAPNLLAAIKPTPALSSPAAVNHVTSENDARAVEAHEDAQPLHEASRRHAGSAFGDKYLEKNKVSESSLNVTLVHAFKDKSQRWVFEFDNGQVWQQLEARYLKIDMSSKITGELSEGIFGSYDLKLHPSSKTIKVKRLQ